MRTLKKKSGFRQSKWGSADAPPAPDAITLDADGLATERVPQDGDTLPLQIQPKMDGLDLKTWLASNWDLVGDRLRRYGAILFRGFSQREAADFYEVVDSLPIELIDYMESSTPRKELKPKFYTATEFPPEETIALHNELSTAETFPMKVFFFCETPPPVGGETPIADVRRVYQRIAPEIRADFENKGWSLIRNYGDGFGLDWRESFHTEDKRDVEAYCRRNRMDFEWKPGDRLRTRQARPAAINHPITGERCWFNHMAFWHIANLRPEVRDMFESDFALEDLPYHTYFGDGSPIPDRFANHIRDAYQAEKRFFRWRKGDLLMLDNVLTAHGRHPYEGARKVLVSMGEAFTRTDIAPYESINAAR